jgi:nucleoside-diphosphate-sugar epimerase
MESKPILLITGVTGYLGAWITFKALETGKYSVRGTCRDKNNQEKLKPLKEALGDKYDDLELFSADLDDKESLKKAVEGCTYVFHVASPYPGKSPSSEDAVIKPAVNGNLFTLEACIGSTVKKVVITSSCAAIMDFTKGNIEIDETNVLEVNDNMTPYVKSKLMAEQEAVKFLKALPKDKQTFIVSFVNPGVILGPLLMKGSGTSIDICKDLLTGKFPPIPNVFFPIVDVRDVADAHFAALEKGKHLERYALNGDTHNFSDLGDVVYKEFHDKGFKPRHSSMGKCLCYIGSFFDKDAKMFYAQWDVRCHVMNDKSRKELGMKYIALDATMVEMCYSLIKLGMVVPKEDKADKADKADRANRADKKK